MIIYKIQTSLKRFKLSPFNPESAIVIFIHFEPRIAVTILVL